MGNGKYNVTYVFRDRLIKVYNIIKSIQLIFIKSTIH